MTEAQQSDSLKNLIRFVIGLAILGVIVAFAWYFIVDLPIQQAALSAPMNKCWGMVC